MPVYTSRDFTVGADASADRWERSRPRLRRGGLVGASSQEVDGMAWEIDERMDGCSVWAGRDEKGRRVWKVTTNVLDIPVEPVGAGLYSRAVALEVYRADHPETPAAQA
jgi:hypothetical protein